MAGAHWLPAAANGVVECVVVIGGDGNLELYRWCPISCPPLTNIGFAESFRPV